MPTSTRSSGYRKKPSTEPAQGGVKHPKAVVTVHSDGTITATGPGASAGKAEAEKSVARVKKAVAETNGEFIENAPTAAERRKHERIASQENLHGGIGLADLGKKILHGLEAQDPTSSITRKYAEGEAKNLADVARESVTPGRQARGIVKAPSSKETQAALTILGATTGGAEAGAGEKALSKVASEASNAKSVAKVGERIVAKIKGAPRQAAKDIREYPGKKVRAVKAAPKKAKATVARAPELKTVKGQKAAVKASASAAKRHPVRSGYLGAAALPPGVEPGEIGKRARGAAVGSLNAILHHPEETAKTTLRALPAAITGPVDLGAAAVESATHGTTKPLEETAKEQAQGLGHIIANTFSGDPKKAEEAARKEGSLTLFTPLPAVTRLKPFKAAETGFRDVASATRRRLATKGQRANRSIRHAPEGVDQNILGLTERHGIRKKASLVKQRVDNPARVSAAHHERQITKAIAKAPKGSHVTLQTLAEYGIRDAKGARLVREKGPGDAQLVKALDYADSHPEVWKSKDLKKALAAVKKAGEGAPAALVGKGERARLIQQGDLFGVTRPEHMSPVPEYSTRADAWKALTEGDREINALRKRGRERLDQAKVLKGAERQRALTEGKSLYAQARSRFGKNRELYGALKDYTRPDQSIDASIRKPYDEAMLKEYARKVEAERKAGGLDEAIWTHHAPANGDKGAGIEKRFPTNAGRVEHMREGNLAKADNLDRSLEGLIKGTVHMPRLRAAGRQFGRDFVKEFQTPFKIDGKEKAVGQGSADWTAITTLKSKDNPNGGQFDPKSWSRFPYREWKNAVKDPFTTETDLASMLHEAEAGRIKGSEPWVLMPREAIKELRAQISPDHNPGIEIANAGARVANRAILGTNPAWAIAQTVAEGVPLLMAKPSLLNPLKVGSLERDIRRYRKDHPEEALALQATAGASPVGGAALRTPLDMQETYTPELWEKGAHALTRGKAARSVLSLVKLRALGEFDVRRQNEYRTLLATAEADKRFRSWHSSLTGLFDRQAKLSRDFKGKSRAELWDWLTTDAVGKKELGKITDYVDDIQGNWTAFTRYERSLAPFTIFYPFLRYSLRWTLWTFPRTHPVTATIAYMLGQANANQLEKLTGGPLENPIAYSYPTYQGADGEQKVLPGGSRISPGQSNLTQAIATGNPAQILSSANPFLGAGITATTGIEPFTGEEAGLPRGWAAVNQLLALPAPLRLAGVKVGGGASPASKAFAKYDPTKTERSLLFPFLPQSGKNFKGAERLGKQFATKYGEGHVPGPFDSPLVQKLLFGGKDGGPEPKLLPEVLEKIHKAELASGAVKKAEAPFYGDTGGQFSELQKELLEAVENAWETGPDGRTQSSGQYGSGEGQYSSGPGQYSKGPGQYSAGIGQYGG